eukprot:4168649-Alexandrium_andersonii.AAC.1
MVEATGRWPSDLCASTSICTPKPASDPFRPLSARVLTEMASVYRAGARRSLADLDAWVSSWHAPALYAGA